METFNHGLGRIKQNPDDRDFTVDHPLVAAYFQRLKPIQDLPAVVDNTQWSGKVLDQGELGSCTAFAATKLAMYYYNKTGVTKDFEGSELFFYYHERVLEGTVMSDSGATIRDAMKVFSKFGYPVESLWPYDPKKFTRVPPAAAKKDGLKRLLKAYVLIDAPGVSDVVGAMEQQIEIGNALEIGTNCYSSIMTVGKNGYIPLPKPGERPIGGHALPIMGYDRSVKIGSCIGAFIGQNSWGKNWGMTKNGIGGYFYLPYSYFRTGYRNRPDASDIWAAISETWSV